MTFVGHGAVDNGRSTYANRSATRFLQNIRSLFDQGLGAAGHQRLEWVRRKLVINLVGCELDDFASAANTSFAGEVAHGLVEILNEFGVPLGDVELHARQGAMSVDKSGRKSRRAIKYVFDADDLGGKTGRFVRETPLLPPMDRTPDDREIDEETILALLPAEDLAAVHNTRAHTWLDRLIELGLRKEPIGTAFELPQYSPKHNVVVPLGSGAGNQARAAAIFNNDPRHSTFIAMDGTTAEHAVYLDRDGDALVVREGWSNLLSFNGIKTIEVVGAGAGPVDAPVFEGYSPTQLADFIEPILRRATIGRTYGQSAGVVIKLVRNDSGQPSHLFDSRYVLALSAALLPSFESCGLALETVVFTVSRGHAAYTPSGVPGFMTSAGDILTGALGEAYEQLHEIRLGHDDTETGPFERERLSFAELQKLAATLEALRVSDDSDEVAQKYLGASIHQLAALMHEDFSALQRQAPHRDAREQMLAELQEVNALREDRNTAIASLTPPEGKNWLLVPEYVEALAGGKRFRIAYIELDEEGGYDREHPVLQWHETDDDVFMRWAEKAKALGEILNKGVTRAKAASSSAATYFFSGDTEGGAAHTLTAAFLLQSLIGTQYAVFKGTEEQAIASMIGGPISALSPEALAALKLKLTSLRNQTIVNYAQLTAGLVAEAGEMIKLVNILRGAEATVSLLAKAGAASSVLSVAFDIANVVFASIDLAHATTPQEKCDAGLRVGIASVGAAVNVGAISAAAVAAVQGAIATSAAEAGAIAAQASAIAAAGTAATVAAVLGAVGVLVAGAGVGAYAVYSAYEGVYNKQTAILDELESTAQAIKSTPIAIDQGVLTFADRVAMKSLDLRTGQLVYGEVTFREFVTHAFAVPSPSASLTQKWTSMYEPYIDGSDNSVGDVAKLNDLAIVLPVALNRGYAWSLADDPGLTGVNCDARYPALSDLAAHYPETFFYIYRALGIVSYGPTDLRVEYRNTPFSLFLDESARSVVIPSIEQSDYRRFLSYTLVGGGGEYSLVMPRQPVALDIKIGGQRRERWSFDITAQAYADGMPGDTLAESRVREGLAKQIVVSNGTLIINGLQWASFSSGLPENITFSIRLSGARENEEDAVVLAFNRDLKTGKDRAVLNVPHVYTWGAGKIADIKRLVRASGISARFIAIADQGGGTGLLDFEQNIVYCSYAGRNAVSYDVNGERRFSVKGDSPLDFATVINGDKTECVVMWQIGPDMRADLSYDGQALQSAIVRTSPQTLQGLMARADPSAFTFLGEWLSQVPSDRTIFFIDGEGGVAGGRHDPDHHKPFLLTQYVNQTDAIQISLDRLQDHAMLSASGVRSFGPQDLLPFVSLLASVGVIELVLTGIAGQRMSVDIDLDDPLLQGKRIVLLADHAVDLHLDAGPVSWTGSGPDVQLLSRENTVLNWLDAQETGGSAHTLAVQGQDPRPLEAALERLPFNARASASQKADSLSVTQLLQTVGPDSLACERAHPSDPHLHWSESAARLSQSISALGSESGVLSEISAWKGPCAKPNLVFHRS